MNHLAEARKVFDIELAINGELAIVTMRTQIPRTVYSRPADYSEHGPGAEFLVARLVTTSTRQLTLIRRRRFELQQFTQGAGASLMEGGAQGALDCL